jgi:hypothetical protein
MQTLAEVADLLAQNKLVIKVQTFPFDRAAEAYRISQGGHVRGKLVLIPPLTAATAARPPGSSEVTTAPRPGRVVTSPSLSRPRNARTRPIAR